MRQCRDDALRLTDAEAHRGHELVNACLEPIEIRIIIGFESAG